MDTYTKHKVQLLHLKAIIHTYRNPKEHLWVYICVLMIKQIPQTAFKQTEMFGILFCSQLPGMQEITNYNTSSKIVDVLLWATFLV